MRLSVNGLAGLALVSALASGGCGDDRPPSAPTPTPGPAPTAQFLRIEPNQLTLPDVGATRQLRVLAGLSDGTERDVTAGATWGVSDPRILTIAPGGLARAVGHGTGFYSASHEGMSSSGGAFVVDVPPDRKVAFTGVVRDQRGRPVPAAAIGATGSSNVERSLATSDGNGFFDLGAAYGPVRLHAAKFGYDNTALTVVDVLAQPRVEITLVENPSPYIERVIEDEVQATFDEPVTRTHTIVGRAGTTLDMMVEGRSAPDDGSASGIELHCGAQRVFPSGSFPQVPGRFTAQMSGGGCRLVVTARRPLWYRVTYREAR